MLCEARRAEPATPEGGEAIGGALFPGGFRFGGPCARRCRGGELYLSRRLRPPLQGP